MYAIVKTGGKQYRVAPDDLVKVERLPGEVGDVVVLDQVLMLGTEAGVRVGTPLVEGAAVSCELVEQGRGRKIIIFKKKRRKHYRRKRGHRQHYTLLRVLEILADGAKPSARAAKKAAPKKPAGDKKAATRGEEAGAPSSGGDDLSLLSGVGPVLEKKLREAGISTFRQIAELTPEQAAELDEKLNLRGRIEREEWIEQAKELMAGKAPRAKVDQKKAARNTKDK